MTENKYEREQDRNTFPDPVVASALDVFSAVLNLGTAITRTVAEATSNSGRVAEPANDAGPVNAMVHYSVTAVTNVLQVALSSARQTSENTSSSNSSSVPFTPEQPPASAPSLPTVRAGTTLRLPLTIENRSLEPIVGMMFICNAMKSQVTGTGRPLTEESVRFQPSLLDIKPKDFEKLTVFIDTDTTTAPGIYEAVICLESGVFQKEIQFQIVSASTTAAQE